MNEEYKAIILAALEENDSMVNAGQKAFLRSELRTAREELRSNTGLLLNVGSADLDSATLLCSLLRIKLTGLSAAWVPFNTTYWKSPC